jgi:hypothetical protein
LLLQVGTFSTPLRDGWGITTIGRLLVVSDGSSKLTWLDPAQGFKAVKTVTVTDGNRRIGYLNEVKGRHARECCLLQSGQPPVLPPAAALPPPRRCRHAATTRLCPCVLPPLRASARLPPTSHTAGVH